MHVVVWSCRGNTLVVRYDAADDEHVEYLVTVSKYIKLAREEPLWYP